jgi:type I restriction enzyme M protein
MRRSLGDKRRKIGEKEDGHDQISEIVQLFGRFESSELCKIFENDDFGYTRVTVERPLRLRYQMTTEDKSRFLDAYPQLLDDVQAIDKAIGRETRFDWNAVQEEIEDVLRKRKSKWKGSEQKLFRSVFTRTDQEAQPVLQIKGYEADPDLRDFENVPLKDDIESYFKREVIPHIPDAWMDRSKDKIGFEINFNRHFYRYVPPRPLEEIDVELKQVEDEILQLLREVTE